MVTSEDLRVLCTIAKNRSLADVARVLNVTPSSISQRVQAIEKKLQYKVIDRQSRTVRLTEEGRLLVHSGEQIIADLDSLNDSILSARNEVKGVLKVLAPLGFGNDYVAPIIAEFKLLYPHLVVELTLSDTPNWADKDAWDLMIYIGELKDSSLHLSVLAKNQRFLCASPNYLKVNGTPSSPDGLHNHDCITLRENNEDVTMWRFVGENKQQHSVRVSPSLACNEGRVVKEWALDHMGIIMRSEWDVAPELSSGELERVLPEFKLPNADIVALLSSRQGLRAEKTSQFLSMLKEKLSTQPWYDSTQ